MKAKELRKLLVKAVEGDTDARRYLQAQFAGATVFVLEDGKLDVDATTAAIQYRVKAGVDPDEWDDVPTVTFDRAFAEKLQLNPLSLKPITPGTWANLWKRANGHLLVAAVYYGKRWSHIIASDLEIKRLVKAHLSGSSWLLLQDVLARMDADEDGKAVAMAAVIGKNAPPLRAPEPPVPAPAKVRVAGSRTPYNRAGLLEMMKASFNLQEIKDICFDLGVGYDDFGGEGLSAKTRELVLWAERNRRMEQLVDAVRRGNPHRFQAHFG